MRTALTATRLDDGFVALADKTRRAIQARLSSGEARVTEVAAPFDISLNSVSKHIRILERAGLLARRRSGRDHYLRLEPRPLAAASSWLLSRQQFWTNRVQRLQALLDEADASPGQPSKGGPQAVKPEDQLVVTVDHRFRQSAERVFDAWLDVRQARRFLFTTETGEMIRCDIDPRVGGRFVPTDRRPDGDVEHAGEYLVIDRPRRLVFTFGIPAVSPTFDVVTLDITPEADGGCALRLTAEMQPEWKDYADRAREGWARILCSLDAVLAA